MRISSAIPLMALAACGQSASAPPAGETIACALDGASSFADACTAERSGDVIVVHRPDGGFRRIGAASSGVMTDGAEAVIEAADGTVTIGNDRYRLPN